MSNIAPYNPMEQRGPTASQYPLRPAVQAFEAFLHQSFGPHGAFAAGLVAPPRIDRMERRLP